MLFIKKNKTKLNKSVYNMNPCDCKNAYVSAARVSFCGLTRTFLLHCICCERNSYKSAHTSYPVTR